MKTFGLHQIFRLHVKLCVKEKQKKIIQYYPSFVKTLKKIVMSTSFSILAYWNESMDKANKNQLE